MDKEKYNRATNILSQIAHYEYLLQETKKDMSSIGYLFDGDEIKVKKLEKINELKQHIRKLKKEFKEL